MNDDRREKRWCRFVGEALRAISQVTLPRLPSGEQYENTWYCFKQMIWAARDARYLGLVPHEDFVDRRNGETVIKQSADVWHPASISVEGYCDLRMPLRPWIDLARPTIPQRYHIEIIVEKSTIDDVIDPICTTHGVNYTSCVGEISVTRCFELLRRARASGKPTIVLYITDFDPAGRVSMPVACARKLEFLIRNHNIDIDLQLRSILLTHEQCIEYELPRTPIKEGDRRAGAFEARYGEGATELDALEALHPGVLGEILTREIERYRDLDLDDRLDDAISDLAEEVQDISDNVTAEFEDEYQSLKAELDDLNDRIKTYQRKTQDPLAGNAPNIEEIEWPEPEFGDEDPDPLYASSREYVEQVDRYKLHQGKTIKDWEGQSGRRGRPRKVEAAD